MTHILDTTPNPARGPRESNLRKNVLHDIQARGGWAFATTGAATNGIPDIVGAHRGVPLALELKTPTGRATPRQQRELRRAAAAGATAEIVRTRADLAHILDRIDQEHPEWTSPS